MTRLILSILGVVVFTHSLTLAAQVSEKRPLERKGATDERQPPPDQGPPPLKDSPFTGPPPMAGRGRPVGPPLDPGQKFMFLVENNEIREALKLTPEQKEKLKDAIGKTYRKLEKELRDFGKRVREKMGGRDPETMKREDVKESQKELQQIFETATIEFQQDVKELLDEKQWTRLKRISFALSDGLNMRVIDENGYEILDLSEEQKESISKLSKAHRKEISQLHEKYVGKFMDEGKIPPMKNFQELMSECDKSTLETRLKIENEVLTAEQKEKAKSIVAEEAELIEKLNKAFHRRGPFRRGPQEAGPPPRTENRPLGPGGSGGPERRERERERGWER